MYSNTLMNVFDVSFIYSESPQEEESYVEVVIDTKHTVKDHYHVYERLGV